MLRWIFILKDTVIVISDGLTDASPHCSWFNTCEYTEGTKNECAYALCKAQGFSGGKFLNASNDFCTESFTDDSCYIYRIDTDEIVHTTPRDEAQITAECHSGNKRH